MNKPVSEAQLQSAVPAPKPARRLGRRALIMAVSAAAVVLIGSYGVYWWNVGRWMQTTDDAYVGGNTAPLATQVSGFVTEILFDVVTQIVALASGDEFGSDSWHFAFPVRQTTQSRPDYAIRATATAP